MHAWEAIQKTVNYIEEHVGEDIQIDDLAEIAALSLFYYQRLFTRLVKKPVREYIKLRRLGIACDILRCKEKRVIDVAMECGFGSHESFTRAFKEAYGITPAQYRDKHVSLKCFEKPDLLLNYVMVDEGVPLISDGLVYEINRKTIDEPVCFLGVKAFYSFVRGPMLGEQTGIHMPGEIWNMFFKALDDIPHTIPCGRWLGVSYRGDAPEGFSTYFAGAEIEKGKYETSFTSWQLPPREYIVCGIEAENQEQLSASLGKAMKFTRFWLKKHGLIADGFFTDMYFNDRSDAYAELWIPFRQRE